MYGANGEVLVADAAGHAPDAVEPVRARWRAEGRASWDQSRYAAFAGARDGDSAYAGWDASNW